MKQTLSSLSGDTIKAIVLVCLAVGVVGMSYGSLAVAYGFPLWVPLLLSVSVLAGASEFMFIGIVASGGSPLAAAAAGLLVNARHIPFGGTVRGLVGRRALSFIGCHIMNDESVVFGLSQPTPAQRKAAYCVGRPGLKLPTARPVCVPRGQLRATAAARTHQAALPWAGGGRDQPKKAPPSFIHGDP
ncbi:AzlC family ABC transporter permease [Pseudomonas aeruginosa]|nr:AzlC family ABC transporter permease [Pseudomonas aeruginosa]